MFKKIWNWLWMKPVVENKESNNFNISPEDVDHPDPLMRELVARCWNTEQPVIATRDEFGVIKIVDSTQRSGICKKNKAEKEQ